MHATNMLVLGCSRGKDWAVVASSLVWGVVRRLQSCNPAVGGRVGPSCLRFRGVREPDVAIALCRADFIALGGPRAPVILVDFARNQYWLLV